MAMEKRYSRNIINIIMRLRLGSVISEKKYE